MVFLLSLKISTARFYSDSVAGLVSFRRRREVEIAWLRVDEITLSAARRNLTRLAAVIS